MGSALLAASKSALKSSKSNSNSTSVTNCFTNNDTDSDKNNATTNVNATFTLGMEYEEDINNEENEEADSAFANNKKHENIDSMRTNTDIESDRSTHISF